MKVVIYLQPTDNEKIKEEDLLATARIFYIFSVLLAHFSRLLFL
ncbi:hypothetical protein [Chitinophaga pinensis]|nr:hypothetical protein [Chitinophaga pinensis]